MKTIQNCMVIGCEMKDSIECKLAGRMRGYVLLSGSAYPIATTGRNPVHIKVFKSRNVDWQDMRAVNDARNDGCLIKLRAMVASNGKYFVSLPCLSCDEKYDILFDRAGYLDYVITGIPANATANVHLPKVQMTSGDIAANNLGSKAQLGIKDGMVDDADLCVMSGYLQGDSIGVSKQRYISMDLDDNGKVDIMDLAYLLSNRGSRMSVYRYREVVSVIPSGEIHVPYGSDRFSLYSIFSSADYLLPKKVSVELDGGEVAQISVAWELSDYDPTLVGVPQNFTGIVIPSCGVVNPNELDASVTVVVDRPFL